MTRDACLVPGASTHIRTSLYLYCSAARGAAIEGRLVPWTAHCGRLGKQGSCRQLSREMRANDGSQRPQRLRGEGHRPGRLGPQGNLHRRDRDARPDGGARGVRQAAAAEGRAHRRLAAHDHPDGRADRDAQKSGRRRALGLLQHLLDAGPRRRGHRRRRHPGVRRQGRVPRRLLGLHPPHLRVGRRRHAQHDPRRRRRRHVADPPGSPRREGRHQVPRRGDQRGGGGALRLDQAAAEGQARLVRRERQDYPRRHRGDHHRRAPALRDAEEGHAAVARHQRQRQRHQVQVRQPLRLPREPGRRHPPRHRRDDGRQGRHGLRATATSARARPPRCGRPAAA